MIRDVHVTQDIFDEPDWGYEKETPSPTWDELNGNDPQRTITQVFPEEAPLPPNASLPTQFRVRTRSSDEEAMTLTQELMEEWSPPDPRFNQRVQ